MPVSVINMIPTSLSGETGLDSEPSVAVNPANRLQIAASAFTRDPASSGSAPIFVSTDGGNTWSLNVVLPGGNQTGDISLRFASTSGVLYGGILRADTFLQLNILRSATFTAAGLMTLLQSRATIDQPWVESASVMGGAGSGADRVYVSNNDFTSTPAGRTAHVDRSLDAATAAAPAGLAGVGLEARATSGQDGPPVRTAVHHDGTIYGAFLGWRGSGAGSTITSDVVVVRDDNWAAGATPFTSLVAATDGLAGVRVATGVTLPPFAALLGTQRTGSAVALAVDPRDARTVYVAWIDGATGAAATIHLRRSTDGGQNWSADLRTISTATNPCLAVNVQGKVGFMYQQLGNPGTGNRWRTHLEVSADAFATAPTDFLLADVPDTSGTYTGPVPIGDYANLIAMGKDFFGVFAANNTPTNANFPNGVTYQRNANFATSTLLNTDNVTPVGVSIDPFFVHYTDVAVADDFYVRDWTDGPASGDNGLEPSTHPVFYATSDVWNRRGTLPGTFPNDQPENEPAGNGASTVGDNWAFARIRRNAAGTAPTVVSVHFLVSKLGTGSNYVDASVAGSGVTFAGPDPTVTFNAADLGPLITPPLGWHLDAVTSTHLCLAVEISAPGDPFVPPSLLGRAPGWPTTDLSVLNDNNKAQRNMGLSTTTARGLGLTYDLFAIVHNAATFRRDITVQLEVAPEVADRLRSARVRVIGGREAKVGQGSTVVLPGMEPGENRWVQLSFRAPWGRQGESVVIGFNEIVGGKAINGFALGARMGTRADVIGDALEQHRSVFARLAAFAVPGADEHAQAMTKLGRRREPSAYVTWVRSELDAFASAIAALRKANGQKDPFGVRDGLRALERAARSRRWESVAAGHCSLVNRLDAFLTSMQLERGDPADILQCVRWQEELYARTPALRELAAAARVRDLSHDFITAYGQRQTGAEAYPKLIAALLEAFRRSATALPRLGLVPRVAAMADALGDSATLQKAHRQYLLALDRGLRTRVGRAPTKGRRGASAAARSRRA